MLTISATLSADVEFFQRGLESKAAAGDIKRKYNANSDHLAMCELYNEWNRAHRTENSDTFVMDNSIRSDSFYLLKRKFYETWKIFSELRGRTVEVTSHYSSPCVTGFTFTTRNENPMCRFASYCFKYRNFGMLNVHPLEGFSNLTEDTKTNQMTFVMLVLNISSVDS